MITDPPPQQQADNPTTAVAAASLDALIALSVGFPVDSLTRLGLTAAILAFIFFSLIILLTSPVWFLIAAFHFIVLSFFEFWVTAAAALTWLYRYFCGMHPPGLDQVDYARSRLANIARGVNDYARECGGYLHSKIKDVAPGT